MISQLKVGISETIYRFLLEMSIHVELQKFGLTGWFIVAKGLVSFSCVWGEKPYSRPLYLTLMQVSFKITFWTFNSRLQVRLAGQYDPDHFRILIAEYLGKGDHPTTIFWVPIAQVYYSSFSLNFNFYSLFVESRLN